MALCDNTSDVDFGGGSDGELTYRETLVQAAVAPAPRPTAAPPQPSSNEEVPLFKFGQHKGVQYDEITDSEPSYYYRGRSQKKPSRQLQSYLRWVEERYCPIDDNILVKKAQGGAASSTDPERVERVFPKSKGRGPARTTLMKQAWALIEKCDVCEKFDRSGSNAYYERKTCVRCGHTTKVKKDQRRSSPSTCTNAHYNALGSTKNVKRFTCTDCGEVLYEEARGTYNARKAEKQRQSVDDDFIDLGSAGHTPQKDSGPLTCIQAGAASRMLAKLVEVHARKDDSDMDSRDLHKLLDDAIDMVKETSLTCPM